MCIGESHPFRSDAIQIRRGDLGLGVVGREITVALIIREHDDDVRFIRPTEKWRRTEDTEDSE